MSIKTVTPASVAKDFLSAEVSKELAFEHFKALLNFPACDWAKSEASYEAVKNLMPTDTERQVRAQATMRQRMTWIRQNSTKPWEKSKKNVLTALVKGKSETTKKTAAPKTELIPLSDDQILIRVGVLGNQFLTAESDRATLGRLITAITNQLHAATNGKKK